MVDADLSLPELNYPLEVDDRATDFDHIADSLCEDADAACVGAEDDHTDTSAATHTSSTVPLYIPITIHDLFAFPSNPTNSDSNTPLEFFWKSGIRNVELEMRLHEELCGEGLP